MCGSIDQFTAIQSDPLSNIVAMQQCRGASRRWRIILEGTTYVPPWVLAAHDLYDRIWLSAEANSTDSDREKDVYAIYSLMLTNPQTSHGPDDNERYLIATTTAPGVPREPCVRPPKERKDREADFREVLADLERSEARPRQLRRALSIQKPYVLLSADEVREFREARSLIKNRPGSTDERFRGVTDRFTLSDVYFNQRRTLALTAISSWCGNLCGLYQWKVFERLETGNWEDTHWPACFTIAKKL